MQRYSDCHSAMLVPGRDHPDVGTRASRRWCWNLRRVFLDQRLYSVHDVRRPMQYKWR